MLCVYGLYAWVCAEVKIMDRKLAEPSHQLIDKICDQREGGVLLWHSLLIGNGRGECVLQTCLIACALFPFIMCLGHTGGNTQGFPQLQCGGGGGVVH